MSTALMTINLMMKEEEEFRFSPGLLLRIASDLESLYSGHRPRMLYALGGVDIKRSSMRLNINDLEFMIHGITLYFARYREEECKMKMLPAKGVKVDLDRELIWLPPLVKIEHHDVIIHITVISIDIRQVRGIVSHRRFLIMSCKELKVLLNDEIIYSRRHEKPVIVVIEILRWVNAG